MFQSTNLPVQIRGSKPKNPVVGDIYLEERNNTFYLSDGKRWIPITPGEDIYDKDRLHKHIRDFFDEFADYSTGYLVEEKAREIKKFVLDHAENNLDAIELLDEFGLLSEKKEASQEEANK